MAELWADMIVLGKREYSEVPRMLKAKVKKLLLEKGWEGNLDG